MSASARDLPGVFVTLEGGEGVGKSTQATLLAERARSAGREVTQVREPGGTPVGDRIRELLLDIEHTGMSAACELLLYEASRAELVERVIRPAILRGAVVVCDRFTDSTLAYQGRGRGLGIGPEAMSQLRGLNAWATGGLVPDVTVLLDLDPVEALERATRGRADRVESEGPAFHERVRAGFLALAEEEPARVVRVDAAGEPSAVAERVWAAVAPVLRAEG